MAYITKKTTVDGIKPIGSNLYGTCSTASGTATKTVSMPDFNVLVEGVTIHVYFENDNTADNATLKVGSTAAKPIRYNGQAGGSWEAGGFISFTYYNESWIQNDITIAGVTYTFTINDHAMTISGSDGSTQTITLPDNNTTYTLSKSGSTITLMGSDGSTTSVTDDNTTYSGMTQAQGEAGTSTTKMVISPKVLHDVVEALDDDTTYSIGISGHTITLTPSEGTPQSVTVPDNNTTYTISKSGNTVTLTGSDGSTQTITLPDNNTTYTLSKSGSTITLMGSDGSTTSVTDDNTTYSGMTQAQGEAGTSTTKMVISPKVLHDVVEALDDDTTYSIGISGHTITLTPSEGTPQSVTVPDNNTTYTISKSGNTVTLTGSDGSTQTFTDSDTTYSAGTGLQLSGTTFSAKLGYTTSGNNRKVQADANGNLYVVQKDSNTTYSLTQDASDGHKITLTPSSGTAQTVTIPDNDTKYTAGTGLSLSGTQFSANLGYTTSGNNRAVLADSNGKLYVTQKDDNTTYTAGAGLSLSGTEFSAKTGYTTSGNNRKVQTDSNGNLYVVQKDDNTTYTAGDGLQLSGTEFSAKTGYTTSGNNRAVQTDANGNLYVVQKDSNTTYSLTQDASDGHKITLTPSSGTAQTVTIPDNDTKYTAGTGLSLSGTQFSANLGYTTSGNNRAVLADSNGKLYVTQKDDNTTYTAGAGLSLSGTEFSAKTGYTTSGNNRKVQTDSNGNLYVVQKDDNTTYTAGDGLQLSGTEFSAKTGYTTSGNNRAVQTDANGNLYVVQKDSNDNTFKAFYGTCNTAAATATKDVTLAVTTGWQLVAGTVVGVKFTNTNTAQNPKLNINGTGAKSIYVNTAVLTTSNLWYAGEASRVHYYMYDGSQWIFMGHSYDWNSNTTYTAGTGLDLDGTEFNHSNSVTAVTAEGLRKVKYDAQGHITGSSAVAKADITALGIPGSDTNNRRGFYGTCTTAAATAAKVVTLGSTAGWELVAGTIVGVKFSYTNTASNPTLNVNSSGAKSIIYNTGTITTSNLDKAGYASRVEYYMYDGTNWVWINWGANTTYTAGTGLDLDGTEFNHSNSVTAVTAEGLRKVKYDAQGHITGSSAVAKADITALGIPGSDTNNRRGFYGTCTTAAATAAKVVTLGSTAGWELVAGTIVGVKFSYTNTASNPTLNVNSSGAKSIIYNTGTITTSNLDKAGYASRVEYYMYDGTNWVWINWGVDDNSTYYLQTYTTRQTDADVAWHSNNYIKYLLATSTMTSNKPTFTGSGSAKTARNGQILHLSWDTDRGLDAQIAVTNKGDMLSTRGGAGLEGGVQKWTEWVSYARADHAIDTITRSGTTFTATRADGTTFTFTQQDNNTWHANTASAEGYVAKGSGHANKVWKTDADEVPAWRDEAKYPIFIATGTSGAMTNLSNNVTTQIPLTVTGTNLSGNVGSTLALNSTAHAIAITGEGLYRITASVYIKPTANSMIGAYIMYNTDSTSFSGAVECASSLSYATTTGSATNITRTIDVPRNSTVYVFLCGRAVGTTGKAFNSNPATFIEVEQIR